MAKALRVPHPLKLTHAKEFTAVLAGQCRLSGRYFTLRADVNVLSGARLGLIAGRKAARRAVDRNRGKRLVREAFRAARLRLPPLDVVLQLRNDLRKANNQALRKEVDRLLHDVAVRFGGVDRPHAAVAAI